MQYLIRFVIFRQPLLVVAFVVYSPPIVIGALILSVEVKPCVCKFSRFPLLAKDFPRIRHTLAKCPFIPQWLQIADFAGHG
jgi:hypothetical protein